MVKKKRDWYLNESHDGTRQASFKRELYKLGTTIAKTMFLVDTPGEGLLTQTSIPGWIVDCGNRWERKYPGRSF